MYLLGGFTLSVYEQIPIAQEETKKYKLKYQQ